MSNTDTGGPAFPRTPIPDHDWGQEGMTLRDYFAAKAMAVYLKYNEKTTQENIALTAYEMADAMLKARG